MSVLQRLQGRRHRLDHHHHPRPAAEWRVIEPAVLADTVLSEIVQINDKRALFDGPGHDGNAERAFEVLMDLAQRLGYQPVREVRSRFFPAQEPLAKAA